MRKHLDRITPLLLLIAIVTLSYIALIFLASAVGGNDPHGDGRCVPADCPPAEPSGLP